MSAPDLILASPFDQGGNGTSFLTQVDALAAEA
jgi:hypothetical protein